VVETPGQVFGVVVRGRGLGGNLVAFVRSLGGGEIREYTALPEDTRRQAIDRLAVNATAMGANAVLTLRFDSSELGGRCRKWWPTGRRWWSCPRARQRPVRPMLRRILVLASALVCGGAALPVGRGVGGLTPVYAWVAIQAALLLIAVLAERGRYRPRRSAAAPGWQRTAERFQDPTTGRWMVVEDNPRSGERRCVPEERP
jgi:uncharacterized protein YbjQ (UPF0145 family)